ncbi:hypothetical protein AX16_010757 [Volvariella volvacea WC 439]|nr:hypothetical protein AX16_010757 [Volvariella volvacea WC 439]
MVANTKFLFTIFAIVFSTLNMTFVLAQGPETTVTEPTVPPPNTPETPAPTDPTTPPVPEPSISPCIMDCATAAADAAGCDLNNATCWCPSETFHASIGGCLQSTCPEELPAAEQVHQSLCADFPSPTVNATDVSSTVEPSSSLPSSSIEPTSNSTTVEISTSSSNSTTTTTPITTTATSPRPGTTETTTTSTSTGTAEQQSESSNAGTAAAVVPIVGNGGLMAGLSVVLGMAVGGWAVL